jgi:Histidine kinase/Histidine kinase-, DNA gyrase B-, and HSP90-like ATPase
MSTTQNATWRIPVPAGLRGVSWRTFALILAINTGYAAILSIEDTRPFWHPFISAQCFGLSIAFVVNAISPWEKTHPVWRLVFAAALGSMIGMALLILIKGYGLSAKGYGLSEIAAHPHTFVSTLIGAFCNGLFVGLLFLFKYRDARAQTQLLRAEADRNLLSKQAAEAELKLMQAQVEPHFLFNTLASVQFLTETDPPMAGLMLGHLLSYLRSAVPQLRSGSTTLGQEAELARAYLSIMQMRMETRLRFAVDIPESLRSHPFPPMLLMSVVENAIKHGIEPHAEGGEVRLEAKQEGGSLVVSVTDSGRGFADHLGQGMGLTNLRERLKALYGQRSQLTLEAILPHGAKATIEIPDVA